MRALSAVSSARPRGAHGQSAATRDVSQNIVGVSDAAKDVVGRNSSSVFSESPTLTQQAKDLGTRADQFLQKVRMM